MQQFRKAAKTRLPLCATAIAIEGVTLFATEPQKLAGIFMARGIVLANLGEVTRARADMTRALNVVTDGKADTGLERRDRPATYPMRAAARIQLFWLDRLFGMMASPEASAAARTVWASIVAQAMTGH